MKTKISKIYKSQVWTDYIEVKEILVVKDTPRQLALANGGRLNKDMVSYPDCAGNCYGYTKEEALENLKKKINRDIDSTRERLNRQESYLNLPVKYL